jgi:hypothetical protein
MSTSEAHNLVGHRVRVGMGADGIYVGEFLELQGSHPWHGRVRITGVLRPAQYFNAGSECRRGYRPGEFLDVGNGVVDPTIEAGHGTYLEALSAELGQYVGSHSGYQTSQYPWVSEAMGRALSAAMEAETHRLATGQWRVSRGAARSFHAED